MKYLLYYKLDSNFIADQTSVGGDGTKVVSVVDGVAWTNDQEKAYYRLANNNSENLTSYTVTVHYKSGSNKTLAPDDVYVVDAYVGKSVKETITAKGISGYTALNGSNELILNDNAEYTFYYKAIPDHKKPLTFNIISAGTIGWQTDQSSGTKSIEYKKNDGEWTTITSNTGASAPSISVNVGDVLQFKGNNAAYAVGSSYYNCFIGTAKFEIEGNIMSLTDSKNFARATTLVSSHTFDNLFYNCTGLTSTENLVLPATTLAVGCYASMFQDCTSLTTAPELPASTLAQSCYHSMFQGCTSLTTAPELPATTLVSECYRYMFYGCTNLTTAPSILPATILANSCYGGMFRGCTSLTSAPVLPATTLAGSCYSSMFEGCTSLTTAPSILPATTLAYGCYENMFNGCTSLATAPELPAPILPITCYDNMFNGCTSLNYIKCLATDISARYCTRFWVNNISRTGTFIKDASMTRWSRDYNGIPANWTVQDNV